MTWTSGGADNLAGLAYYAVFRGSTQIGTTSALSFSDSLLATSGAQSYTVKAVDLAGNTSAATSARAITFDPTPPGQPGKPAIPSPTHAPVLTWAGATDTGGSNIARYDVYRTLAGGSATLAGSVTGTTFTDTGVSPDGAYSYDVVAVDGAGNQSVHSAATAASVDITPPDAPASLTAQATLTASKPSLSWTLSSDNGGSGIAQYVVFRGAVQAGVSTGTTFIDTTLATNGSYSYTVKAVDAAGNLSAASSPLTVTWDSTAPPVPINLTATSPTSAAPALSWQSGGGASDFDHYDLFRGSTLVYSGPGTSYTDDQPTPPPASGNLSYTVKSVDALGNSSSASTPRPVLYDITQPGGVTTLNATSPIVHPVLTWTAATDTGGLEPRRLPGLPRRRRRSRRRRALTFADASLSVDGSYAYVVRAIDGAGNLGPPSPTRTIQVDQTPPPAPIHLVAASPANVVAFSWDATADTGASGSGVASYRVYRNGSPLASTTVPAAYTDTTVSLEGTWTYTVAAIDARRQRGTAERAGLDPVRPDAATTSLGPLGRRRSRRSSPTLTWIAGGADALSGFAFFQVLRDGNVVGLDDLADLHRQRAHRERKPRLQRAELRRRRQRERGDTDPAQHLRRHRARDPDQRGRAEPDEPAAASAGRPRPTAAARRGVVYYRLPRRRWHARRNDVRDELPRHERARRRLPHLHGRRDRRRRATRAPSPLPASTTVDVTPPDQVATPTGASPTARPVIAWDPSSDSSGIARYDVYRGTSMIGSSLTPSFIDAGDRDRRQLRLHGRRGRQRRQPRARLRAGHDRLRPHAAARTVDRAGGDADALAAEPAPGRAAAVDLLSGFDHYIVYRDGVAVGDSAQRRPSWTRRWPTLGPHLYVVRAVDVAGNVSASSPPRTVIYDTQPPPTPTDLTVPTPTNAPVLTWTASNDDSTGRLGRRRLPRVPRRPAHRDPVLADLRRRARSRSRARTRTGSRRSTPSATRVPRRRRASSRSTSTRRRHRPTSSVPTPTQRPSLSWGASDRRRPAPSRSTTTTSTATAC